MNNLTLDAANFSEQLGIYDFFNIIVSGTIFIFGLCSICKELAILLWTRLTIPKGIALIAIIYLTGLVLQEISSLLDKHIMKVQTGARYNFLKESIDEETELSPLTWVYRTTLKVWGMKIQKKIRDFLSQHIDWVNYSITLRYIYILSSNSSAKEPNSIIHNQPLLHHYRKLAQTILYELYSNPEAILVLDKPIKEYPAFPFLTEQGWNKLLNEDFANSYVYSVCQYYVSSRGKDKKVEKLRALFDMSRTLTICFFILLCATYYFRIKGIPSLFPDHFSCYVILFFFLTIVFRLRMNKTIRNMTLIMLGNYDALLRVSEKTKET